MKKIIYNIAIVLAASCLFASCEDDNYDEPNSGIKGRFIDAETSEVVPMPHSGKILARLSCLNAFNGFFHVDANYFDIVLDVRTSVRNNERGT